MISLEGRKAIVCGSTQGIGRACAHQMARAGAEVTLVARHAEGLETVRHELAVDHQQQHRTVQADFTDWQQVRDRVGGHIAEHGPFHILVNNTGGPAAGPAFEAAPEDYLKGFTMHVLCGQAVVQAVAPGMRDEKYGRIINIISTSVIQPIKGLGVSNTIRGAVANWAKTLASELGPFGITVNNILPGYTSTARLSQLLKGKAERAGISQEELERGMKQSIPLRRFASADEIGSVAAFLASPLASYVSGVNLQVDGGRLAAQ